MDFWKEEENTASSLVWEQPREEVATDPVFAGWAGSQSSRENKTFPCALAWGNGMEVETWAKVNEVGMEEEDQLALEEEKERLEIQKVQTAHEWLILVWNAMDETHVQVF